MTTILTPAKLAKFKPCVDQLALFRRLYPDGVEVTAANVLAARKAGLYVDWLIGKFSEALWGEYDRRHAPLRAEYLRQYTLIWAKYERQRGALRTEYLRQRTLMIWAEYRRQHTPLLADCICKMLECAPD